MNGVGVINWHYLSKWLQEMPFGVDAVILISGTRKSLMTFDIGARYYWNKSGLFECEQID